MLFDLQYGWRKWRGQRLQWWIYVLGLSVITALFSLILQLKANIDDRDSHWTKQDAEYLTLAAIKKNGTLDKIQGYPVKAMQGELGINNTTNLLFKRKVIRIGNEKKEANILFYDANFTDVFRFPARIPANIYQSNSILVNESFTKDTTQFFLNGHQYNVSFSLPPAYSSLSGIKIDILMPVFIADQFNPFISNDSEANAESLRLGLPEYYGIAIATEKPNVQLIADRFANYIKKFRSSSDINIDNAFQSWVKAGIELRPKAKRFIDRQLLILVILFSCCVFIFISNYYSLIKFQQIKRATEFRLKRSLGANNLQLLLGLAREQLIFLLTAIFIALALAKLTYQFFTNTELLTDYFATEIPFDASIWILSFIIFCIIFLTFAISIAFANESKLSSSTAKSKSLEPKSLKKQKTLELLQFTFATIALSLTTALSTEQIASFNVDNIELDTQVYQLTNPLNEDLSFLINSLDVVNSTELVLSATSLFAQDDPTLQWGLLGQLFEPDAVNLRFISNSAFALLTGQSATAGKLQNGEVAINYAMAKALAAKLNSKTVLGSVFTTKMMFTDVNVKISKVIENVPHHGLSHKATPFVYYPLTMMEEFGLSLLTPYVYCHAKVKNSCKSKIENLVKANTSNISVQYLGDISDELEQINTGGRIIFTVSLLSSFIILTLLFSGFYFQAKNIIQSKVNNIGTKLALGANKMQIHKEEAKEIIGIVFMSAMLSCPATLLIGNLVELNQTLLQLCYTFALGLVLLSSAQTVIFLMLKTLKLSPNKLLTQ